MDASEGSAAKKQKLGAAAKADHADGWPLLSVIARERLNDIGSLADCELLCGTTLFTGLHRVTLAGGSKILRNAIVDIQDTKRFTVHDDEPEKAALMISTLYEPRAESLTEANIDAALQMVHKYDCPDLRTSCDIFVVGVSLTPQKFPRWMALATTHELPQAISHCHQWAAEDDNFSNVMAAHQDAWLHQLPVHALTALVMPRLRLLTAASKAMAASMDNTLAKSAVPSEIKFAVGVRRFFHDGDRQAATPIDRGSVKIALESMWSSATKHLEADRSLAASAMQKLLPEACRSLPPMKLTAE